MHSKSMVEYRGEYGKKLVWDTDSAPFGDHAGNGQLDYVLTHTNPDKSVDKVEVHLKGQSESIWNKAWGIAKDAAIGVAGYVFAHGGV